MEWLAKSEGSLTSRDRYLIELPDVPPGHQKVREKNFLSLKCPLWTENKAKLIGEYIKLFTYITKHGAYIDGFAAPQRRDHLELCSAKLVLDLVPQRVREFWLCDLDPVGVSILEELQASSTSKRRRIHVLKGDFNKLVDDVLLSGRITEKTAAFALLDQRTFECEWSTVEKIARHKKVMKIEMFYFVATGWLTRSMAATRRPEKLNQIDKWWGGEGWRNLRNLRGVEQAKVFAERFSQELGYKYVYPYAIHDRKFGGRAMYYMIHATDHAEASPLMIRAYRKTAGQPGWGKPATQSDFDALWL